MIESVSLRQMQRLYEIAKYDTAISGQDYVYVHVTPADSNYTELLQNAIRFNGMIIFVVRSGKISFAVNMDHIRLGANQMGFGAITEQRDRKEYSEEEILAVRHQSYCTVTISAPLWDAGG